MKRLFTFFLLVGVLCWSGCEQPAHPGNWPQTTVESKLKSSLNLTEIALTPATGGFSGTGKTADGETFKLTITQDATAKKLVCKATGDRGTMDERTYDLDQ